MPTPLMMILMYVSTGRGKNCPDAEIVQCALNRSGALLTDQQ